MLVAIIPAKNEAATLTQVIKTLLDVECDLIIPVINGCTDESIRLVAELNNPRVNSLYFTEPLGIDIPRAIGAAWAYQRGATTILFVDGDMTGDIAGALKELVRAVERKHVHMALTNCYPPEEPVRMSSLTNIVLQARLELNQVLGLEETIGSASPSHGPHAISRTLLEFVPVRELAIPPVALSLAVKKGLAAGTGVSIPHAQLGSPQRDAVHSHLIAETIIGDCLEAIQAYQGKPRNRSRNGITYTGYNQERRFDLLEQFLNSNSRFKR